MKKSLLVLLSILLFSVTMPVKKVESEEGVQIIPDDAIRLRILANSDEEKDQQVKHVVRDEVNAFISELVVDIANIEVARQTIRENLAHIRSIVAETLQSENENVPFTVDYSNNVTFPMKMYDHYLYPAGEYEAVLITLGEGKGANWWCVLFPPLCFLDFSNGTTVEAEENTEIALEEIELIEEAEQENEEDEQDEEDEEEVEVTFFLFEWLGFS